MCIGMYVSQHLLYLVPGAFFTGGQSLLKKFVLAFHFTPLVRTLIRILFTDSSYDEMYACLPCLALPCLALPCLALPCLLVLSISLLLLPPMTSLHNVSTESFSSLIYSSLPAHYKHSFPTSSAGKDPHDTSIRQRSFDKFEQAGLYLSDRQATKPTLSFGSWWVVY